MGYQIVIGRDVHVRLPPDMRDGFELMDGTFPYNSIRTGKPCPVYVYVGKE